MAIDNLNIMTSWIPAWQQTDKYSSQPWCLRSKNLDIFSSSKSVKWTAWTTPTQSGADVIYDDGVLCLKTDGKVYENGVLFKDVPAWFITYQIAYDWRMWTYSTATRWTTKDMTVQYENGEWKCFTVFSDRASYTYNKVPYTVEKSIEFEGNVKRDTSYWDQEYWNFSDNRLHQWYCFTQNSASWYKWLHVNINYNTSHFWNQYLTVLAREEEPSNCECDIYLDNIQFRNPKYYYDAQDDSINSTLDGLPSTPYRDENLYNGLAIPLPNLWPYTQGYQLELEFYYKTREGSTSTKWTWWELWIWILWWPEKWYFQKLYLSDNENDWVCWDHNEYYTYLPISNRKLKDVWEYKRMKWSTQQTLYNWWYQWILNDKRQHIPQWDLQQSMAWENSTTMDVIDMIVWNENVQMIGNQDGNGYIIPCYLTWWKGTPYIAYWCTFKGAMNIDYLLYLVGEDRGVSQLRVFNGQELAPLIWWNRKDGEDFIDTDEQYRFNGMMVEYKWNLILATEDNRIFEYWQTYGGKGGSFILDVPWTITWIKVQWDDLIVFYSITETVWWVETTYHYTTTYQDAETKKNFLNREAEYPIAIGNHLLEKEESDLYLSYKIPNKSCSLEFRWNANHYTFWTFKVENPWSMDYLTNHFKINGTNGDYYLEYVESHWDEYTFKLVGDLPEQTNSTSKTLLYYDEEGEQWNTWATYEEYHHFRYIGEITADGYKEGEYRFHNLNNLLDLPKSHTLQIKVIGKGNNTGTPELFTVDLVANQRNRW